jgi:hypothetical protein
VQTVKHKKHSHMRKHAHMESARAQRHPGSCGENAVFQPQARHCMDARDKACAHYGRHHPDIA